MNCLVFGRGPWGQNVARTLHELGQSVVVAGRAGQWSPVQTEAAFICTPARTHAKLVHELLDFGIPIFCEKPFTLSAYDAVELKWEWEKKDRPVFLVDHTQLFNRNFLAMAALAKDDLESMEVRERGTGPYRPECSGLWDWGPHAIAEVLFVAQCKKNVKVLQAEVDGPLLRDEGVTEVVTATLNVRGVTVKLSAGNGERGKRQRWLTAKTKQGVFHFDALDPVTILPLTSAISTFLRAVQSPPLAEKDFRFGMELPLEVIRTLDEIDLTLEAKGIPRLQRQGNTM